jgi:hypothetical protein
MGTGKKKNSVYEGGLSKSEKSKVGRENISNKQIFMFKLDSRGE